MLSPMNLVYNWYNLANIFLPIGCTVLLRKVRWQAGSLYLVNKLIPNTNCFIFSTH